MEVSFYHLTRTPLEKTLPKILEKVLASGLRAVVVTDTQERLEALDIMLWTYNPGAFLPHGTHNDGQASYQPIWLTTHFENPNGSQVIVVTDGTEITMPDGFKRCIDLFNGLDEATVIATRERWKNYQERGLPVVYWRQDEEGRWQKNMLS